MAHSLWYGKATFESKEIKDREIVVVFRAQNQLLPRLLRRYKNMCINAGSSPRYLDEVEDMIVQVLRWQAGWGTQVPGTEPDEERASDEDRPV